MGYRGYHRDPSRNLASYSEKFGEADEKSAQYYDKLIVYFEYHGNNCLGKRHI